MNKNTNVNSKMTDYLNLYKKYKMYDVTHFKLYIISNNSYSTEPLYLQYRLQILLNGLNTSLLYYDLKIPQYVEEEKMKLDGDKLILQKSGYATEWLYKFIFNEDRIDPNKEYFLGINKNTSQKLS